MRKSRKARPSRPANRTREQPGLQTVLANEKPVEDSQTWRALTLSPEGFSMHGQSPSCLFGHRRDIPNNPIAPSTLCRPFKKGCQTHDSCDKYTKKRHAAAVLRRNPSVLHLHRKLKKEQLRARMPKLRKPYEGERNFIFWLASPRRSTGSPAGIRTTNAFFSANC